MKTNGVVGAFVDGKGVEDLKKTKRAGTREERMNVPGVQVEAQDQVQVQVLFVLLLS
jgi:hypothetical protein